MSRRRTAYRFALFVQALAAAAYLLCARAVLAHPMGNLSISHHSVVGPERASVSVRHTLDFAEIPTAGEMARLDVNADGEANPVERDNYAQARAREVSAGLRLTVDSVGACLDVTRATLDLAPGEAGLNTLRLVIDLRASLPPGRFPRRVSFRDANYPGRAGWKEVVVIPAAGVAVSDCTAPTRDVTSGLRTYPRGTTPPQQTEASFTVSLSRHGVGRAAGTVGPGPARPPGADTEGGFAGALGRLLRRPATPGLALVGLLLAFAMGAGHALAPGHGKAMVAAYLVGSQGTPAHAVALGIAVTAAHTLGVFALGLVALAASRYVVPERLYAVLSLVGGLGVLGVGIWLLRDRLSARAAPGDRGDHHHSHHHPETAGGGLRRVILLGLAGGIVPCPSALLVLLAAVALHRLAYGMLLITAFSAGLASVLVVLGLLVVAGRGRLRASRRAERLQRALPLVSAAVVTAVGVVLVARALFDAAG